jgi:hypothetical protein
MEMHGKYRRCGLFCLDRGAVGGRCFDIEYAQIALTKVGMIIACMVDGRQMGALSRRE